MNCFWIQNTEATLGELRDASGGVAVLPLTSIESHGPHLPLGSDPLVMEELLRRLAARETVAILPTLLYSYVADARMLLGAIHIRSDILMDYVECILDEVARNGFRKLVLLHGHGGNVLLDTGFLRRLLEREKPYAVYSVPVLAGAWPQVEARLDTPAEHNGHACEFETSMNLVSNPELVRLDLLGERTFPNHPAPQVGVAQTPVDWTARHPEMAVGFPQRATAEKGEQFVALWVEALVEHLRLIKADTVCLRETLSYNRRAHAHGASPAGDGDGD